MPMLRCPRCGIVSEIEIEESPACPMCGHSYEPPQELAPPAPPCEEQAAMLAPPGEETSEGGPSSGANREFAETARKDVARAKKRSRVGDQMALGACVFSVVAVAVGSCFAIPAAFTYLVASLVFAKIYEHMENFEAPGELGAGRWFGLLGYLGSLLLIILYLAQGGGSGFSR